MNVSDQVCSHYKRSSFVPKVVEQEFEKLELKKSLTFRPAKSKEEEKPEQKEELKEEVAEEIKLKVKVENPQPAEVVQVKEVKNVP